jgi:Flp pilus assembly protein TadG
MRLDRKSRPAATLVEFAIVGSVTFFLLIGLLVGGMGIFRYNEVASLAREGSRWASVRGTQYQKDTGKPAATQADVYNNVIVPEAVSLDLSTLKCFVAWDTTNSPYRTQIVNHQLVAVNNTVTVTIHYQWIPEAYLGGITLSSTSVTPMSY